MISVLCTVLLQVVLWHVTLYKDSVANHVTKIPVKQIGNYFK